MELYFPLFLTVFILIYIFWDIHLEDEKIKRCETRKMRHAFYCTRCKQLYTAPTEISNCPYCSQKNQYLHF